MTEEKVYTYKYPHAAITADNVVIGWDGEDLNLLLVKRKNEPCKNQWAFPGGFMEIDETIEHCAERELMEETTFQVQRMEQLMVFSTVDRDPRERVLTVAFLALVKMEEVEAKDDAAEAKWVKLKDISHLAFDHDYILGKALERLREKLFLEPICFDLLDEEFTMHELQRLYEAILSVKFERKIFERKILSWGILEKVEKDTTKPMEEFYRFDRNEYEKRKEKRFNKLELL